MSRASRNRFAGASTLGLQEESPIDGIVKASEILTEHAPILEAQAMRAERKGDWIQTYSGVQFWPMDARPEDVRIEDIAHALSNLCRFGGHTNGFYSVAQHSVLVSRNCPPEHMLAGLLHDATEAYLVDVPSPIKRFLDGYKEIEAGLAKVIGSKFGVDLADLPAAVHEQDARALWTEKRDVKCPQPARWPLSEKTPWPEHITPWGPSESEARFLARFEQLTRTPS